MKEEILSQQLAQVLSTINDGAPELFRQVLLSGYIFNIAGVAACILAIILTIVIFNMIEEDKEQKITGIVIFSIVFGLISLLPLSNLIKIIFVPKAYILAQLIQ